ncbi:MAG: diacylglycerol kinase family lipid kinase [Anaerolineae bacterium]|jgi:YegS/Rv2252/BmrU family lipid kinase
MRQATIILNPTAGRGTAGRLWPRIDARLRSLGLDFELATTQGAGHAVRLAEEAACRGCDLVVAVGGDGTANEVLNGLLRAGGRGDGPCLGVLPVGTGNDFACGADVPLALDAACETLVAGVPQPVDVGCVRVDGGRPVYFGNGIGIGFDAIVLVESQKWPRLRGFLVYLVAVLRTILLYYHAPYTSWRVDDRQAAGAVMMVSVMNGRRLGGGFLVTPAASMRDGLLDVCVAGTLSRPQMLGFVPRFLRGTHVTDPRITTTRGRRVHVEIESPWAAHMDGELLGVDCRSFEIELLPGRLCLVA